MTNSVGDNTNICPECSTWHDSMKGIYLCWVCGSPEMVKRANEPTAYEDLHHKVKLLKEDAERLVSAIQHRGSFNEIMAENFGAVMNHKQVMREVEK